MSELLCTSCDCIFCKPSLSFLSWASYDLPASYCPLKHSALVPPQTLSPHFLVPRCHSTPSPQPIFLALRHLAVRTKLVVLMHRHLVRLHPLGHVLLISHHYSPLLFPGDFTWGDLDAASFSQSVMAAYNEVLHWQKNFFPVPYGSFGKRFMSEMSQLYRAYAAASSLEGSL